MFSSAYVCVHVRVHMDTPKVLPPPPIPHIELIIFIIFPHILFFFLIPPPQKKEKNPEKTSLKEELKWF